MWQVEKNYRVRIGSNYYINVDTIIAYHGKSLFTIKRHDATGYLGIDFDIYNAKGGKIAVVKRNEIYFAVKDDYLIEGSENQYLVTEKSSGRIICDIKKREAAHPAELDINVRLYTPSGFLFEATPEYTNFGSAVLRNCTVENGLIGVNIV